MKFNSHFFNNIPIAINENEYCTEKRYEYNLHITYSKFETEMSICDNERKISIFKQIWTKDLTKDLNYLFYLYSKTRHIKKIPLFHKYL